MCLSFCRFCGALAHLLLSRTCNGLQVQEIMVEILAAITVNVLKFCNTKKERQS